MLTGDSHKERQNFQTSLYIFICFNKFHFGKFSIMLLAMSKTNH